MTGLPTMVVEIEFTAGVWTDVSSRINLARNEVTHQFGRSGKSDDGQPGTFSVVLENMDGALTPDNPTSAYFPNVVPGKRVRWTVAGTVRFLGTVTSFDPSYSSGVSPGDAVVAVAAKDGLGTLADVTLPSLRALTLPALATNLSAYWPFTDPAATPPGLVSALTTAGGANVAPAVLPGWWRAAGPANLTCGYASELAYPDGETWAQVSAPAGTTSRYQSRAPINTLGATASLAGWFKVTRTTGYDSLTITVGASPDTGPNDMSLILGNNAGVAVAPRVTGHAGVVGFTDTLPHHFALACSAGGAVLYIDGIAVVSNSDVVGFSGGTPSVFIDLVTDTPGPIGFYVSALGYWQRTLSAADVAALMGASTLAGPQQQTLERVTSIAAAAGLSAALADGAATHGKVHGQQATAGKTGLAALQTVVRGDTRLVWDNAGTVTVRTVDHPATVSVTLDAEADLDGSPTWQRSDQTRYSQVTASSPTAGEVVLSDAAARSNTASVETALASVVDVQSVGQRLISEGRDAKLRLAQLNVDLVTAQNSISTALLALVLGDRVRVSNLPTEILGWSYQDGYVLGVKESVGIDHYRVTLDLEPADAPPDGTFDDATYGRFGVDGVTTVGVLTSSGTTVVITSAGTPFTTVAGSYPMDVDINGERVTLNNPPGGGTSPQTFTGVTRGVAPSVARAHTAGEPVDVWLPARFTY